MPTRSQAATGSILMATRACCFAHVIDACMRRVGWPIRCAHSATASGYNHRRRDLTQTADERSVHQRPCKPRPFGSTSVESVDILSDNLTRPLRRERANVREDKQ